MQMKTIITLLFAFCFSISSTAQYTITIEAFVQDVESKKPISFVNIGFLGKGIGTVSNEKGYFKLTYDEDAVWENEILQFSCLGYQTKGIKAKDLFKVLQKTNKGYLKSEPITLEEVEVFAAPRKEKYIGTLISSPNAIGYWKENIALGGEIATRLKIRNKNSKLKELELKVLENISDSIRLRINIYDYD